MIDVSIVIVNWNTEKLLIECINSIVEHTVDTSYEIIVVDNASSDNSVGAVKSAFPNITVIENENNEGFARANNIGISASAGRYVLLSNTDIKVLDQAIDKMVKYMDENPDTGSLLPKCLDGKLQIRRCCRAYPTIRNLFNEAVFLDKIFKNNAFLRGRAYPLEFYRKTGDAETMPCCFMIIPQKTIKDVGFLDDHFFFYGEDIDWCKRVALHGYKVIYFADTKIVHYGGSSTKKAPARFIVERVRAMLKYMQKHHSLFEYHIVSLIYCLHYLLRATLYLFIGLLRSLKGWDKASFDLSKKYFAVPMYIFFKNKTVQ